LAKLFGSLLQPASCAARRFDAQAQFVEQIGVRAFAISAAREGLGEV
jgi:hypothetical protein